MVHVTTNACSAPLTRVDFYVGGSNVQSTSASGCADPLTGDVGTLAIVPSGAIDAHVTIGVVGALGGAACANPQAADTGCIIAKRELAFNPHSRLDLPIVLDSRCAGFPCPDGTTCVADQTGPHCESQTCDVDGGVQCISDAGTGPDVSVGDVVAIDAPPPACPPVVDAGAPLLSWSFDPRSDALIHEDHDLVPAQTPSGSSLVTTAPERCGSYLSATAAQIIAPSDSRFDTDTLIFALAYRVAVDGDLLKLASKVQGPGGLSVTINQGVLEVYFTTNVSTRVFQDTKTTNDLQWHTFTVSILTNGTGTDGGGQITTASFSRDGAAPNAPTVQTYLASPGPLWVGPAMGIDQVEFFAP